MQEVSQPFPHRLDGILRPYPEYVLPNDGVSLSESVLCIVLRQ